MDFLHLLFMKEVFFSSQCVLEIIISFFQLSSHQLTVMNKTVSLAFI